VLRDGKPLAKAVVQLAGAVDPYPYERAYVGSFRGPERSRVDPILYPTAATDAHGIARFRDLVPGIYNIYASAGDAKAVQDIRENLWPDRSIPHAVCRGIAIRAGDTRKLQLAVYPQPNLVEFRVLQADGKPISDRGPFFDCRPAEVAEAGPAARLLTRAMAGRRASRNRACGM
jgi:hypothetical protein